MPNSITKQELKIGLALSGGGIRAAVFHLGVLGRLAAEELLEHVTFISTVSGGSLGVGLIYSSNQNKWPTSREYIDKCTPFAKHHTTYQDLQRKGIIKVLGKPKYWLGGRAKIISEGLRDWWDIKGLVKDLPSNPRWIINATTYETGKNWRFMHKRMGDYMTHYVSEPEISIADALASSAAYPGLIGPLKINTCDFKWFKYKTGNTWDTESAVPIYYKLRLWDGGVYDNLGMESLFKPRGEKYRDGLNFLLVSDASADLGIETNSLFHNRAFRLVNIAMDQVRSLRARMIVSHFQENENTGSYFKIGLKPKQILERAGTPQQQIDEWLDGCMEDSCIKAASQHKTTLKAVTENQYDILYRHGWETANYTLIAYCPDLFEHIVYCTF